MMHYLTRDAIPVFAELIPDCAFTEWDTPSEIGIKLVCAYVLKHETGRRTNSATVFPITPRAGFSRSMRA